MYIYIHILIYIYIYIYIYCIYIHWKYIQNVRWRALELGRAAAWHFYISEAAPRPGPDAPRGQASQIYFTEIERRLLMNMLWLVIYWRIVATCLRLWWRHAKLNCQKPCSMMWRLHWLRSLLLPKVKSAMASYWLYKFAIYLCTLSSLPSTISIIIRRRCNTIAWLVQLGHVQNNVKIIS